MAYHLHLTFHTPVGVFSGHLNREPLEKRERAQETFDSFQHAFNQGNVNHVVLFNRSSEVSLPGQVLASSVMVMHIEEVLPSGAPGC